MRKKVKDELDQMLKKEIITKIDEPTVWCSPIFMVPKNRSIRLTVDYTGLNTNFLWVKLQFRSPEESLSLIGKAEYFCRLDTNSGFWQVSLEPSIGKCTTFIIPFRIFKKKKDIENH